MSVTALRSFDKSGTLLAEYKRKATDKMNTTSIIIGNMCSLLGMACDSFSASRKSAKGVLIWQSFGQFIYGLSSFVLKGYSGAAQSAVSILRNCVAIAKINSKVLEWALVIFGVVFGLLVNNRGVMGLLPVIANSEYSVAIFRFKDNERALKISFLICIVLFSVFNVYIKNYVGTATNAVVFASTAAYLVKKDKK